jgi:hypothetical protein
MTILRALLPLAGLLINAAVQIAVCRAGGSLLRSIFAGFTAGFVLVAYFSGIAPILTGDILCYGAFGYCYFHFLNLGETARRIRLIRELNESPDGLTEAEFLAKYNCREILVVRMERLLVNGQIVSRNGRYFTGKPALLVMARMITLLKLSVLGRKSEFEDV